MTPLDGVAIAAAGVVAGSINAIVGSGSLITFPTLLAVGYPPVLAQRHQLCRHVARVGLELDRLSAGARRPARPDRAADAGVRHRWADGRGIASCAARRVPRRRTGPHPAGRAPGAHPAAGGSAPGSTRGG